jgi:hypothetical protein
MNLTCFYSNSEIPGNKNKLQNFLHPGSFDPGSLTGGARGPPAGDAGAEARAASAMAGLPPVATGTALRRGNGRGKGSRGTLGSPGGRRWSRFGRRSTDGGGFPWRRCSGPTRNGDGGGDSGHGGLIPSARRTREARRCWRRARRRSGMRLAAALAGGHGGELGLGFQKRGERRRRERNGARAPGGGGGELLIAGGGGGVHLGEGDGIGRRRR